ncbi:MAG: T9SS type A sorting domain-containing protein [Lewinellaceae bacterium]|nr:T9SS type A sorting domain-containing protein [Lewinellaceae bacterium]
MTALFFLAATGLPALQAQVFWTENFEDESLATSNWQHDGINAGPSFWIWTDDPAAGYQEPDLPVFGAPTASNGYFLFNSDDNGQTPFDVWLTNINRPADCTGKTGVHLRFYTQYIYFNPAGTVAQIGVSTNGIDFTYQNLFDTLPANLPFDGWLEIDLAEADDQPEVWLQFRWIGNYEYHWKIDDLSLFTVVAEDPDFCETAVDITEFFGQTPGEPQITGLLDNTDATVSATDPEVSCWGEAGPGGLDILNNTLWCTFAGDGGTYNIQTVPCNATNYIGSTAGNLGDTQMLLLAGDDCSDLTPVACNEDFFPFGIPDWRAGVSIQTDSGQQYYILLDGFEGQGVVATGEFCIQVTQQLVVPCADGQVGSFTLSNNGFVCTGGNLEDILSLNAAEFVLPTTGPESGLAWCISPDTIPAGTWPGTIQQVSSTPFGPNVAPPDLLNNGTILPYGTHYLTPVVLGGGTRINAGAQPFVYNIDPGSGCYFVGQSLKIVLLPPLAPLGALPQVTNEVVPPGNNGSIVPAVSGGSGQYLNDAALYQYLWNNGAVTKNLTGLSAGVYTVTISDISGCTAAAVLEVTVGQTVSSTDPALVRALEVRPNPTRAALQLYLDLQSAADVRIEVTNILGQVLETHHAGQVSQLVHTFDLSHFAEGTYLLRVVVGQEFALRRIVVAR